MHSSPKPYIVVTEEESPVAETSQETRDQGLRMARVIMRKYIPEGVNLSEELTAERRTEAAREVSQS